MLSLQKRNAELRLQFRIFSVSMIVGQYPRRGKPVNKVL